MSREAWGEFLAAIIPIAPGLGGPAGLDALFPSEALELSRTAQRERNRQRW